MKAKLLALFGLVLVTGSGVMYFAPRAGTSRADIIDAGVQEDCNFRRVACTFYDRIGGYQEKTFVVALCGGGRRILPRWVAQAIDKGLDYDECRDLGAVAVGQMDPDAAEVVQPGGCACCDSTKGLCRFLDGGTRHGNNQVPPGLWRATDPGWQPVPCGEIFGLKNLPPGCLP